MTANGRPGPPDEMERARAARALLIDTKPWLSRSGPAGNGGKTPREEDAELAAFMAIFHPDHELAPEREKR